MGFFDRLTGPPSRDGFAKAVLDGIKRAGEKQAVVYDKDRFALRTPGKDGHLLNLGYAYPPAFPASFLLRKRPRAATEARPSEGLAKLGGKRQ
jgi:hypothetical protein